MNRAVSTVILLIALMAWQPLSDRGEARDLIPPAAVAADLGNTIDKLAEMVKNLGKRLRSIRPRIHGYLRHTIPRAQG